MLLKQRVVVTLHQVPALHDLSGPWLRRAGVRLPPWAARAGLRAVLQAFGRLAHAIVVHADIFRERLWSEWGVSHRVKVVPHGVTLTAVPPLPRQQNLLLFGYLKWYKGIEIVIEAFRRLADEFPGWMLTIAGPSLSAAYAEALRHLARPLGPRVEFPGRVEDRTADELFARAGVVLFPYRSLFSASGPLAQAMGAAAPFVISDVVRPLCPGWPHWAPLDPGAWVDVLRPMMRDAQIRTHAADLAAGFARAAAWPVIAAQTRTIYESVVS
jgi:glycosyltransferase involved in cell wall biosynthesis